MVDRAPLAGVTVLEICSNLAGPYAGKVLADLGAEVIKVEPPGDGDTARGWRRYELGGKSAAFQAFNTGKRSVTANLSDEADVAKLKRFMIERADVVLQNLRPGLIDRCGLGPAEAVARNPRLVYCDIGAFGRRGPMRHRPGYDPLVQGFTGIIDVTGEAGRPPARVGVSVIDIGTGMWAATGVLAALNRRAATGRGGIVESSLMDTGLAWQTLAFASFEASGEVPGRSGLRGPQVSPNRGFETADGILMITAASEPLFRSLCETIGAPELVEDARFATSAERYANDQALTELIEARLGTASRAEWAERLDGAGVPNTSIHSLDEVVAHPQTAASGMIGEAPGGGFRLMGLPLRFDGERPAPGRPAPELGEANGEIFGEPA